MRFRIPKTFLSPTETMNDEFQLAVINYPPEYSELIKKFNALHDPSTDGLETMQNILENYNPAHYTIWKKRWEFITFLNYDLSIELEWINSLLFDNPKTYQIWNYRQKLISLINHPGNELFVLNEILLDDSKNYHAWSYRQWLIKKFKLADGELEYTKDLIGQDVYNNSAWNHRYFLLSLLKIDLSQELEYVKLMISQYPDNESPWNYYRAVVSDPSSSDYEFVKSFPSNKFAVYTLFLWTRDSTLLEKLSELDHKRSNFWTNFYNK